MKTINELKDAKLSLEKVIKPYIEQFEREFECKVETINIVRMDSPVAVADNYGFLIGVELGVKI